MRMKTNRLKLLSIMVEEEIGGRVKREKKNLRKRISKIIINFS